MPMNPDEIYDGDPDVPETPPEPDLGSLPEADGPPWQLPALVGLFVVLVLVLALSFYMRPMTPGADMAPQAGSTTVPLQAARPVQGGPLMVYVVGEVKQPGVVQLEEGSRVEDAVQRAGGLTDRADRMAINLAARVKDEEKIVIPGRGDVAAVDPMADLPAPEEPPPVEGEPSPEFPGPEGPPATLDETMVVDPSGPVVIEEGGVEGGVEGAAPGPAGARRISLNLATVEELETIKGIGPELAHRIIEWRQGPPPQSFQSVDDLLKVPGIGPAKLEQIRPYVDF